MTPPSLSILGRVCQQAGIRQSCLLEGRPPHRHSQASGACTALRRLQGQRLIDCVREAMDVITILPSWAELTRLETLGGQICMVSLHTPSHGKA